MITPGWNYAQLLKWVHGQSSPDAPNVVAEWVAGWSVILPDGTNLYAWVHPQYQAFVQDSIYLRDCRIVITDQDAVETYYTMVNGTISWSHTKGQS